MSEFIGRQVDFAVANEAVRGTAEATAARTVRKVTCNVIPRSERVIDNTTFGRLEDAERVRSVRKWSEGDVEGIVHADVIGYYFANIYGDVESVGGSASTFEHTFVLDQTILHDTLTLYVKDADVRQEKIAGAVVASLELTATTDDYLRYTASFIGKEGADDTSTLPDLDTEYDFVSRDISVKLADTEAGLAGATALKVKNLTISWNTNAEADWVFGSYSPDNIYNKQMTIEGSMTLNFADETLKAMYEGDSSKYMQITITGEASLGGGEHPSIVILLNKIQVTDWNRSSAGDDLSTQEVSFKAFYNTTDEEQSTVVLTNLTEEYIAVS